MIIVSCSPKQEVKNAPDVDGYILKEQGEGYKTYYPTWRDSIKYDNSAYNAFMSTW